MMRVLTLAGTGHFASFHGTRGGGVVRLSRFSPDWRASRKKTSVSSPRGQIDFKRGPRSTRWPLRSGQVPKSDENQIVDNFA